GQDVFADMAFGIWKDAGVNPEITQPDGAATGAAYIFGEEASGNNALIICPGVAATISPSDVEARADIIASSSVFVTQLEQPIDSAVRALEVARAGGATTILNPAPAAELPDAIYPSCDFVTPNESEAESLTGIAVTDPPSAKRAARVFLDFGVRSVLITLGEKGSFLYDGLGDGVHTPALSAGPVVETTGAGDAFNGGFAVALSEGMSPAEACRFAAATAGLSVTRSGTAPSMPMRSEIDALLEG
ncbi:MAG: ribokinase, partial [Pseudomonadota bacterium]